MHEYSIVQALLARVDAEARARGATAVHRLTVRIGELSGVEIDLLATAFVTFRDRTICAHADLDVRAVAAVWACPVCSERIERGSMLRCAACGVPARLTQGDEILLDRIEMEVP
ncbi:MAG TPA: hydrogenase maturation nickel metallochaperone HypA [Vicinamibacterales bacterium]|nr:hydrogenase maturation nickel metallochaperone HypA [Vicinamibacterales bacterium]